MIKLLLHESKRRVGSPSVFITPGTYFIHSLGNKMIMIFTSEKKSYTWSEILIYSLKVLQMHVCIIVITLRVMIIIF